MLVGVLGLLTNFSTVSLPPQLDAVYQVTWLFGFITTLLLGGLIIGVAKIIEILSSKRV